GFSPSLVQDPVNPVKMVEVHSTGNLLQGSYSVDGGQVWTKFINPNPNLAPNNAAFPNLLDPNLNPPPTSPPVRYAQVTNATVAMDRLENFYVTEIQHDATNNSG